MADAPPAVDDTVAPQRDQLHAHAGALREALRGIGGDGCDPALIRRMEALSAALDVEADALGTVRTGGATPASAADRD